MIRIALAQINTAVGDLPGNQGKILSFVKKAEGLHADIVVFPELAVCGYPPEDLLHKEHFVQDNIKSLKALAKKIEKISAVVGFVDIDKNKNLYNAAAVIAGGAIKGIYHKRDLPNYGVFDEKRYFTAGEKNPLFLLNGTVVGVNVCEDIWSEEVVFKEQVKAGARVIINLSSSPYDFGKIEEREKLLVQRAKKAKAYVCYANLVGGQDELVFDGGSLVISPQGKVIASGKQFDEDLTVVDLPLAKLDKKKKGGTAIVALPKSKVVKKKKIEQHISTRFSHDERIYKALVLGTRDYMQKNGFKKAVIGLSGGIDSAVVAAIASKAVGKENVVGVSMPSQFTSKGTRADAKKLAKNLGIRFIEIPIEGVFATYLFVLREEFAGKEFDVTEENLQARIRGNLLMAFSNKFGWLVLTTGNKSEIAVGYCTLYGDMTGGFAIIKDVPKTKVYEIAKLINNKDRSLIPESILQRPPTAELRKDQKDEDSLPPYAVLDAMLKDYVEDHQSLAQMTKKHKKERLIKAIINLVDKSEYKRRQSPPGIKVTSRAFGKDWRLPITNKYKEE